MIKIQDKRYVHFMDYMISSNSTQDIVSTPTWQADTDHP